MTRVLREFDGFALFRAMDDKRQGLGLSWNGVAAAVWDLSAHLHQTRVVEGLPDRPLAAATIRNLGASGEATCQHALFYLRWLERSPEHFLAEDVPVAGAPLPLCGPDRRPRWNLVELHAALTAARSARGLSWTNAAQQLRCTPSQLTGLKTARYATSMRLAMRITQWLGRSASDFIYVADW